MNEPHLPLRDLAFQRGILIGAEVEETSYLQDPSFSELLYREFNLAVPGSAMKLEALRPTRAEYAYAAADAIVAAARAHRMEVLGHPLVWHKRIPQWIKDGGRSEEAAKQNLRETLFEVMRHFHNGVKLWNVVNEAIDDGGSWTPSFWLDALGPGYVEQAFRWAAEADPDARLIYNEWGAEGLNKKSDRVFQLLKGLLGRGAPVHGVGFQMHTSLEDNDMTGKFADLTGLETNLRRFGSLGLEVYITEMDVQTRGAPGTLSDILARQAQVYRDVLSIALRVPNFRGLAVWGVTDRYSWIPKVTGQADMPLLFDADYQPKPAYQAVWEVLQQGS